MEVSAIIIERGFSDLALSFLMALCLSEEDEGTWIEKE